MFRGTLGRRIAHEMRQERIQRLRSAALTTWDNVINNMVDFSMMLFRRSVAKLPFRVKKSVRHNGCVKSAGRLTSHSHTASMYDISPAAINLFPFAKDEALRATVRSRYMHRFRAFARL
jgi:hypothetical protein